MDSKANSQCVLETKSELKLKPSTMQLNDYCIESIFRFISLSQQIALSQLTEQYHRTITHMWRQSFKQLDVNVVFQVLTTKEMHILFRAVSDFIEIVFIENVNSSMIDIFKKHKFPKVHTLCFYGNNRTNLNDDCMLILNKICPNLYSLRPWVNYTGSHINVFRNLAHLSMASCSEFDCVNLFRIKDVPLQSLSVRYIIGNMIASGVLHKYIHLRKITFVDSQLQWIVLKKGTFMKHIEEVTIIITSNMHLELLPKIEDQCRHLKGFVMNVGIHKINFLKLIPLLVVVSEYIQRLVTIEQHVENHLAIVSFAAAYSNIKEIYFVTMFFDDDLLFKSCLAISHLNLISIENCTFPTPAIHIHPLELFEGRTRLLTLNFRYNYKSRKPGYEPIHEIVSLHVHGEYDLLTIKCFPLSEMDLNWPLLK